MLMALAAPIAWASPLPRDAAATQDGRSGQRWSDADLALSDARLDLAPESGIASNQALLLGAQGGRHTGEGQPFDFGSGSARNPAQFGSVHDTLRSFLNVRRGGGGAAPAKQSRGRNSPPDDPLAFDLGLATNEWVRESVQGLTTSVLNLNVNERGQASFSVLGWGDFSVIVSADRSEIALTSAGDPIVTAQRAGQSSYPGGGGYSASYGNAPWGYAEGGGAAPGPIGESPLKRAIELALEIASHPLSFIVYALIAAYALVWGVLSARAKRPRRASAHHLPSVVRSAPLIHRASAAVAAAAAPAKRHRKRVRVRVRVRKYR